jgi:suppressor of tumorigenicity protein 13
MSCPINNEDVAKLKLFVQFVAAQPSLLNLPQLRFFKDFVEQLGGKVPEANKQEEHARLMKSTVANLNC